MEHIRNTDPHLRILFAIYSLVSYFRNTNEEERGLKGILTSFPPFLQCLYIFPIFPSCVCLHGVTNNILAKKGGEKRIKGKRKEYVTLKLIKHFSSQWLNLY